MSSNKMPASGDDPLERHPTPAEHYYAHPFVNDIVFCNGLTDIFSASRPPTLDVLECTIETAKKLYFKKCYSVDIAPLEGSSMSFGKCPFASSRNVMSMVLPRYPMMLQYLARGGVIVRVASNNFDCSTSILLVRENSLASINDALLVIIDGSVGGDATELLNRCIQNVGIGSIFCTDDARLTVTGLAGLKSGETKYQLDAADLVGLSLVAGVLPRAKIQKLWTLMPYICAVYEFDEVINYARTLLMNERVYAGPSRIKLQFKDQKHL